MHKAIPVVSPNTNAPLGGRGAVDQTDLARGPDNASAGAIMSLLSRTEIRTDFIYERLGISTVNTLCMD